MPPGLDWIRAYNCTKIHKAGIVVSQSFSAPDIGIFRSVVRIGESRDPYGSRILLS